MCLGLLLKGYFCSADYQVDFFGMRLWVWGQGLDGLAEGGYCVAASVFCGFVRF